MPSMQLSPWASVRVRLRPRNGGVGREGARHVIAWQEIERHRPTILGIAARYGARNVRVFESVARGEYDADSDLDLLVNMEPGRRLLDLAGLKLDWEELLVHSVELVTRSSLRWLLWRRILREAQPLLS